MSIAYILIAVLSAWRITELFTMDRITEKIRAKFPIYLWTCPRCMSVWAGIVAAAIYHFYPLANLPFAMSYLYIQQLSVSALLFKALNNDRQITLTVDGANNVSINSQFKNEEILGILQRSVAGMLMDRKPKVVR